jgi:hypothetical protein
LKYLVHTGMPSCGARSSTLPMTTLTRHHPQGSTFDFAEDGAMIGSKQLREVRLCHPVHLTHFVEAYTQMVEEAADFGVSVAVAMGMDRAWRCSGGGTFRGNYLAHLSPLRKEEMVDSVDATGNSCARLAHILGFGEALLESSPRAVVDGADAEPCSAIQTARTMVEGSWR